MLGIFPVFKDYLWDIDKFIIELAQSTLVKE